MFDRNTSPQIVCPYFPQPGSSVKLTSVIEDEGHSLVNHRKDIALKQNQIFRRAALPFGSQEQKIRVRDITKTLKTMNLSSQAERGNGYKNEAPSAFGDRDSCRLTSLRQSHLESLRH